MLDHQKQYPTMLEIRDKASPERNLWARVLDQAIRDCILDRQRTRRTAGNPHARFLSGGGSFKFCALVLGFEPKEMCDIVNRLLSDESACKEYLSKYYKV